jgi:hypothetical protein
VDLSPEPPGGRLEQALHAAEAERQSFQERVEEERRRSEANRESLENRIEDCANVRKT